MKLKYHRGRRKFRSAKILTTKIPFDKISVRRIFRSAKIPFGENSIRRKFIRRKFNWRKNLRRKFRTRVKTNPGADCRSEHSSVVAILEVKLKKLVKGRTKPVKDLSRLRKDNEIKRRYTVEVRYRIETLLDEDDPESQWTRLQEALNRAA